MAAHLYVILLLPLMMSSACASGKAAPASKAGVGAPGTFESREHGIRFRYPADWKPRPSKDYVLLAEPGSGVERSSGEVDGGPRLTLDVPDLPPHLPFMLTLKAVRNGYVDDLRKRLKEMRVEDEREWQAPGAKATRLLVCGRGAKGERSVAALLMIHDDGVYIVSAESAKVLFPRVREAFDTVAGSLEWLK